MKRHVLVGMLCLVGLSGSALPAPLAGKLPADTKAYIGWAGRTLPFDGSMLGQLIREPATGSVFQAIRCLGQENIPDGREREFFRRAWAMASIAWQHPGAIALLDVQPGEKDPRISAALLVDLGKDRAGFDKELGAAILAVSERRKFADVTIGTVTYKSRPEPGGNDVSVGYLGDVFFLAVGAKTPARLIAAAPPKTLGASRRFAEGFRAVAGENLQLAMYVDIEALLKQAEGVIAAEERPFAKPAGGVSGARRLIGAAGISKATVLVGAARIVDRGMYTRVRLFTPAPHTGVLLPLAGTPLAPGDLSGVPADADVVVAAGISANAVVGEFRRIIKEISAEGDAEIERALARVKETTGVSLTGDLFAHLGDKWVLSSAPSQGGFLTGTVLSVQVKDAAKLRAAMAKLEAHVSPTAPATAPATKPAATAARAEKKYVTIETVKAARTEVHYLTFSAGEPVPVAPAWAIHKDRLYLAAWPQVIQAVIEADDRKGITQSPAFRKVRAKVADRPSVLYYVNTPGIVRQVYNLGLLGWTGAANALAGEKLPVRPDWLPTLPKLQKYLWPQVGAVSADAGGITFEGYGSLPSVDMFLLPVQASFGPLMLSQASRQARQAVQANELMVIARALHMYAADNEGRFPESIMEERLSDYVGGPQSTLWRRIKEGGYGYVGGLTTVHPGRTLVVYAKPAGGAGRIAAGFVDGHVEMLDRPAFERALDQARQNVRKGTAAPAEKP